MRLPIRSGVAPAMYALATSIGFTMVGWCDILGGPVRPDRKLNSDAGRSRSENVTRHDRHRLRVQLCPAGVMHILSPRWTSTLLFLCTLSLPSVWALHESEAGVVDWQKTFIGVPRTNEPQAAPSFLRVKAKGNETTSLVISATETAVGAVDPVDGSVGECGSRR